MNQLVRWCFRIGLLSGAIALVSACVIAAEELKVPVSLGLRPFAERAFTLFGLAFMLLGIVLLIAAILRLRREWPRLSKATKVVSVLGLGASTFLGAYVFHWLFPDTLGNQAHTRSA